MKNPISCILVLLSLFLAFPAMIHASSVAVHDPSIVIVYKDAGGNSYPENDASKTRTKYYYVFGTQLGAAYSTDMINWTSFTPTFSVNGTVTNNYLNAFKAAADWSRHTTSENVRGNLWAPDIIYNKSLKKWCLYFSVNGDDWLSSVVMHTADKIEGPYQYTGTVVYSGMDNTSTGAGNTEYQKVTGSATVATRYLNASGEWQGTYGTSCIDPAVLYDQNGKLWLVYGSWSGGIFLLKLSETTGLRDYNYDYGFGANPIWNGTRLRYDPYMGIHIAGGYYVSGEGPYIEYLVDNNGVGYYYLFVSMGFYSPEGGYSMRVFRSSTIDGTFTDVTGDNAVFPSYIFNYGNNVQYGFPIMQNYKWSWWSKGEIAQGHNSALRDEDGKSYLVYHRKFDDKTVFHNVEVHELLFNDQGWPLAAPFEYRKDFGLDQKSIAPQDLVGTYGVITHNAVDYANLATNQEQAMVLHADGSVSGAYSGTWSLIKTGSIHYLNLVTSAGTYRGVAREFLLNDNSAKTIGFTAMNPANERALWGYRIPQTATAQTTAYHGSSLSIGSGNFDLVWNDYAKFLRKDVSGDFEIEYLFDNLTLATENWHNWNLAFVNGASTWHLRADAYSVSTLTGTTVTYKTNWNGAIDFKTAYKNKPTRILVTKTGTNIQVLAFANNVLLSSATAKNVPTGNYTVYLGGESCSLAMHQVSTRTFGSRQRIGIINDDGTYTSAFNASVGTGTAVSGDFHIRYTFHNYRNPQSTDNWDNFILKATAGTQVMYLRADAYAMDLIGSATYTYDWDWSNFLSLMQGARIVLDIRRSGSQITYDATIDATNLKTYHYKIVNANASTANLTYAFTSEESMVDLLQVEQIQDIGTEEPTQGYHRPLSTGFPLRKSMYFGQRDLLGRSDR